MYIGVVEAGDRDEPHTVKNRTEPRSIGIGNTHNAKHAITQGRKASMCESTDPMASPANANNRRLFELTSTRSYLASEERGYGMGRRPDKISCGSFSASNRPAKMLPRRHKIHGLAPIISGRPWRVYLPASECVCVHILFSLSPIPRFVRAHTPRHLLVLGAAQGAWTSPPLVCGPLLLFCFKRPAPHGLSGEQQEASNKREKASNKRERGPKQMARRPPLSLHPCAPPTAGRRDGGDTHGDWTASKRAAAASGGRAAAKAAEERAAAEEGRRSRSRNT